MWAVWAGLDVIWLGKRGRGLLWTGRTPEEGDELEV